MISAIGLAQMLPAIQAQTKLTNRQISKQPSHVTIKFPDTTAGRLSEKWFQAFNSGDYEAIRNFYTTIAPAADINDDLPFSYAAYLDTRGLDIYRIEQSTEYELRLLAQEKVSGEWALVRLRYDEKEPHRQTNFGMSYIYPPKDVQPHGKMSSSEITRQTDALMKRLAAADVFSGAVLIAHNDKIIFKQAYGLANKAYNAPNRTDTKFNIGSITKVLTAVAVMQLAEQGKLLFNDTIGKYLPDYPNKAVSEKVTIHQLLTHTAGLPRMARLSAQGLALRPGLRTVSAWFPLFAERPPDFEPGTRYRYSNEGYIVLGAIIEKASGSNYYDYMKEHVFKPAGMRDTDFYELDTDTPNMATGYTRTGTISRSQLEARRNNSLLTFVKGQPAGAAYSTVEDLLNFKIALFGNKLLSPEYTQMVLTGKVETGDEGVRQAYGFEDEIANGARLINHSGSVPGGEARLEIFPELGYTVISITNYDYQVVHRRLRDMITQK